MEKTSEALLDFSAVKKELGDFNIKAEKLAADRKKEHIEDMVKEAVAIEDREKNFKELVAQGNEKKKVEIKKQRQDARLEKAINEQVNKKSFSDYVDDFKDGFQKFYDNQKSASELFSDVGDAFKQDLGLVTMALGPLASLPGVNTAITVLKSGALFLLKRISMLLTLEGQRTIRESLARKKEWIYTKLGIDRDRIRDRLEGSRKKVKIGVPGKDGADQNKSFLERLTGIRLLFIGALAKWWGTAKAYLSYGELVLKEFVFGNGKKASLFTRMKNQLNKAFGFLVRNGTKLTGLFARFGTALSGVLKVLGWPLALLISFVITIKDFIKGWKATEGNFMQKYFMGLSNALRGLLNFWVGSLLDLVKDTLAWVIGFFSKDMKKAMNDFSFVDIINNMIESLEEIFMKMGKMVQAFGAGALGAFQAGMPGGLTPKEGFDQAFEASMNKTDAITSGVPQTGTRLKTDAITSGIPQTGTIVTEASVAVKNLPKVDTVNNGGNTSVVGGSVINNNNIQLNPIGSTRPYNLAGALSVAPG